MAENYCVVKKSMTAFELVSAYPQVFDAAIEERNKVLSRQAANTGSPKLPPCACCEKNASLDYYLVQGYNFCPFCGRQLRAGA
jgi:hypothetical protein